MAHPDSLATTQNGRCFPRWKCRLIASVAALLVLSAVMGETELGVVEAAPAATRVPGTFVCVATPGGVSDLVRVGGTQSMAPAHRAQPGPVPLVHAMAGVPPWVIWPASPLPRIAGAHLHPLFARGRVAASAPTVRDLCAAAEAGESLFRRAGFTAGWPEPFSPLDRLAGVDQRFPRPPPR